eukprot:3983379-Prymnesium_polylepis.1
MTRDYTRVQRETLWTMRGGLLRHLLSGESAGDRMSGEGERRPLIDCVPRRSIAHIHIGSCWTKEERTHG